MRAVRYRTDCRHAFRLLAHPKSIRREFLRPDSIVWFERIIIGTLLLGIVYSWLVRPQLVSQVSPVFALAVQAMVLIFMLGLTLLISHRRSRVAKWISIALFVGGLPMFFNQGLPAGVLGAVSIIQLLAQLFAYSLLFTPSAKRWFKRDPAHD